ncbi:MAG: hypothetical protein FH756_01635 [Firmicutes bacterium]|nr:hypothetical protein [Bacillota bacterium]
MIVKLTSEDKQKFKTETKKLDPVETLAVARFIDEAPLSAADKKFCKSHIGKRCERLLKNVAHKGCW